MDKKIKTTNITYNFNEEGRRIGQTVTETVSEPADDDYAIESGVELESVVEALPLEIFLTVTAGALLGNLLYRVIRNDR